MESIMDAISMAPGEDDVTPSSNPSNYLNVDNQFMKNDEVDPHDDYDSQDILVMSNDYQPVPAPPTDVSAAAGSSEDMNGADGGDMNQCEQTNETNESNAEANGTNGGETSAASNGHHQQNSSSSRRRHGSRSRSRNGKSNTWLSDELYFCNVIKFSI